MRKIALLLFILFISVLLHAQVSKTVNVTAGGLSYVLTASEKSTVTNLTLSGTIDARDFKFMRDSIPLLSKLDLSGATIVSYSGLEGTADASSVVVYPANQIPNYAFLNSTNYQQVCLLSSIVLPSSITAIGDFAFYVCRKLTSATIPVSVNSIGKNAFGGCANLTSIEIPSSVTSLGYAAFMNCGFTSITIPSSIDTLTRNVFSYCRRLKSVTIPLSVTTIESEALAECDSLTSVSIPSSVVSIGSYAFCYNKSLDSLTIPSSVTSIGNSAFYNCTNLMSIVADGTTPVNLSSSTKVFEGINKTTCTLYVPSGSKALYETADQWKDFTHIVEIGGFTLSEIELNIHGSGGSDSVVISSNASWSVSSDQSWLTVSPSMGTGSDTLIVTATANPIDSVRVATVTISAEGVSSQTIIVTQAAKPTLEVSADSVSIANADGSTAMEQITSNGAWKAASNQSWLTVTPSIGIGNSPLTLRATANTALVERTATVTISADGVTSKLVLVTQNAGDTTLVVSRTTATIKAVAGSTASVKITSNTSWTVNCDESWLTVAPIASDGDAIIVITAEANPSSTVRVAKVVVSGIGVTSQTITVTQAECAYLQVSSSEVNVEKVEGSTVLVDVLSNVSWKAVSSESWLSVSPSSSSLSRKITFTAKENSEVTERSSIVTISGTGVEPTQIVVTQAAGDTILFVSDTILTINYLEGSTALLGIASNVMWVATSSQSWLTVNPSSGSDSIVFTAEANLENDMREALVTISSNETYSKNIVVRQLANPILQVSDTIVSLGKEEGSSVNVDVVSNFEWLASSDKEWLTVSPYSASGNGSLLLTANANPEAIQRSAIVTLSGTEVGQKQLTVIQAAGDTVFYSTTISIVANSEGFCADSTNVYSNVSWSAVSNQTWLAVTPSSGHGDGTLSFAAQKNISSMERTATVTVLTGSRIETITITQQASKILQASAIVVSMAKDEGSTATVSVTSNVSWSATDNANWLTVSPSTGSGDGILVFTALKNTETTSRSTTVFLTSPDADTIKVEVTQVASEPQLNISATLISMKGDEGSFVSIDIVSNTTWTITTEQEWLTIEQSSGSGNATIRLTGKANATALDRPAVVIISAPGVESKILNVVQIPKSGVGNNLISNKSISVYPNPVTNGFRLKGLEGKTTIIVFDLNGKQLLSNEIDENGYISTGILTKGVYIVRIVTAEGTIEKKMVKE